MAHTKIDDSGMSPLPLYSPLYIISSYIIFTFLIAVFGPVDYYIFPVLKTAVFILLVILAMIFGYGYGIATGVKPAKERDFADGLFIRRLFDFSLCVSIITLFISIGSSSFSGQLNTNLSEIGSTYASGYEGYERNSGNYSLIFILYSLSLPFNFIISIFGLYYFFSLNPMRKALVTFFIITSLLFYVVGSGKQKQIGDFVIYLIAVTAVSFGVKRTQVNMKWVVFGSMIAVVALMTFVAVLGQRYTALGVDIANINYRINNRIYFDTSHPIFSIFGMDYGLNLAIFSTYLSQGYYGLGLSLETDWQWTHFMGFSYSVSVLASRIFGFEWEWPNTLIVQVANTTGWDESKWNTIFPFYATDFTFPGTIFIFGYFAYVYARAWYAAIKYENPFAILTFSFMTLGAFFIPANNQLLHSPGGLFTTVVITFLYLKNGGRYNRPCQPWMRSMQCEQAVNIP